MIILDADHDIGPLGLCSTVMPHWSPVTSIGAVVGLYTPSFPFDEPSIR
jgi:hypothetical protein